MLTFLKKIFGKKIFSTKILTSPAIAGEDINIPHNTRKNHTFLSTHLLFEMPRDEILQQSYQKAFQRELPNGTPEIAMDSTSNFKAQFFNNTIVPDSLISWYSSQSFIGYQTCAIIAQHWLVAKACLMPAKDAIRNGYEITVNDGTEVKAEVLEEIKKFDRERKINAQMKEYLQMGRVFGIRIAKFIVESDDPKYYQNPFNIDGVTPGSYKGISQIDPYWIVPHLDGLAAGDPAAPDFYVPTFWNIGGELIHRTHLMIFITEEVADILKPTYFFGGVSIPQKIYERVYAAERTANEAPLLCVSKRTDVLKTDLSEAIAHQEQFDLRMQQWTRFRDNYGIKVVDLNDEIEEFDTSLSDLDVAIMTQYQLVAAIANVPAVKLLGTSPKGFNTTGEFEEANYHEELESYQENDLSPFLERHHLLTIKSEIEPKFGIYFSTSVSWNPLDAMTAKELAELNKLKAETGQILMNSGSLDGQDERDRIINDPESGYNGLEEKSPEENEILNDTSNE